MRKVKIVCTLGPASSDSATLDRLVQAGLDVARLNLSHGDAAAHRRLFGEVRQAAARANKPVAVLLDLPGPKLRIGRLEGGEVQLVAGASVRLVASDASGTPERLSHGYPPLAGDVRPGEPILLDDGLLRLEVEAVEGAEVRCRVIDGGRLRERKGMNLPRTELSLDGLTERDLAGLALGRELGADYFALSFVRRPEDVAQAKERAGGIPVIAKIEKPQAVEHLRAILEVADGVMVARGDLGVELGHEKVPLVQKRVLEEARLRAKAGITATQMLESMIQNPRPTRAEVSDVANAVLDGTDAVMLSAETAIGAYPVEAVETLRSVIEEIESSQYQECGEREWDVREASFSNAVADAAAAVAHRLGLRAIAVYTESGRSAALVSAHRPEAHVIAFSRNPHVLRRLALHWGIQPVAGAWAEGAEAMVLRAEEGLLQSGLASPGDRIAVTFGLRIADEPFQTDALKLWTLRGR